MALGEAQVPFTLQKKPGPPGPFKKWFGPIFLTAYTGNNQVRLLIEKCNSRHGRNHCKAR